MNIREVMNNNPAFVTIGAVVILVLCLGAIMCQLKPGGRASGNVEIFFYDTTSGQLFAASNEMQPPIQAPSDGEGGTSGVKAYVFTCTDCNDKSSHFIGYLERYTPEAKAKIEAAMNAEQPDYETMYDYEQHREVKLVEDDAWYNAMTNQALEKISAINSKCTGDGEKLRQCLP